MRPSLFVPLKFVMMLAFFSFSRVAATSFTTNVAIGLSVAAGVMLRYEPAVDLSQGDGMRFGCSWRNPSDQAIGEGVGVNEMCILFGYAWPPEQSFSVLASGGNACVALAPPSE